MWEDKTMIEEIFNESSIENVVNSNISNLLILCFLVFLFSCLLVSLFLVNWIETKRNQLKKTRQEKKRKEKKKERAAIPKPKLLIKLNTIVWRNAKDLKAADKNPKKKAARIQSSGQELHSGELRRA